MDNNLDNFKKYNDENIIKINLNHNELVKFPKKNI